MLFVVKFKFEECLVIDFDDDIVLEVSSNLSGMSVYILGYSFAFVLFFWLILDCIR